jgi:hypothetical protein
MENFKELVLSEAEKMIEKYNNEFEHWKGEDDKNEDEQEKRYIALKIVSIQGAMHAIYELRSNIVNKL